MAAEDLGRAGKRVKLRCERCGQVAVVKLTDRDIRTLRRELAE
jgi:hypothetical protein